MQKVNEQKVLLMISEQGGYARSNDMRKAGIHPSILPSLERSGRLVRIKRGLYALPENASGDDRVEALLAIPGSVLCLGSALSFHEIGTWEPVEIYLAVQAGRKVRIPEQLPIRLFHFGRETFQLGLIENAGPDGKLRVYDAERTICDLFRFRHRLGTDIASEALRGYMRLPSRAIPRLLEYAERLNILEPLKRSLEALL